MHAIKSFLAVRRDGAGQPAVVRSGPGAEARPGEACRARSVRLADMDGDDVLWT